MVPKPPAGAKKLAGLCCMEASGAVLHSPDESVVRCEMRDAAGAGSGQQCEC